jgi:flagellar M-ring protein FliF
VDALLETLKNLGAGRLAVMLVTFFGLVVFFIFIAARTNTPGMTLLYGQLSTADATEIAAKLDAANIPYRLSDDGSQVTVPQKEVGKSRMLLAQEGLPHEGSVGYEIFDQKQAFGTTSFVENINQLRALEGELSRTVSTIDGVRSARVQLVLPQRELFSKDSNPATASVFLNLHDNTGMSGGQIQAIQHLIAAAVPHLKASNVAIIDQSGNLLARGEEQDANDTSAATTEEAKQKYEHRISRSVEDMVGRIVGYGKVRANVTADMNFDVVNRNSESYNPDGQVVRSTQTTNDDNVDNASSGGTNSSVTVQNNLPGLPGGGKSSTPPTSKTDHTEEVTNYEISKTVEQLQRASGQVQKLSIAVLVDGHYVTDDKAEKPKDAAKDWEAPKKYVPRDQAELDNLTKLVKSAVGFDESRGDSIQVINMQFADEPTANTGAIKDDSQIMGFAKADLLGVAETITLSIVAVLVILLVLRPLATHMIASTPRGTGSTLADEQQAMLPGGARPAQLAGPGGGGEGELENMIDMSSVEGKVKASSVQKISELVQNHPAETVAVIRSWMSQET